MEPRYPEVKVQLTGEDGNAMAILGRVAKALKRGGVDTAEVALFVAEATSSDYDHVLQTCMKWVTVH